MATQVPWGPAALRYQFYRGLPDRIKDRISEVGKPTNLHALRTLAQQIDHRYWERKSEKSREGGSNNNTNKTKSDKPNSDNKSSNNSDNRQQTKNSGSKSDNPAPRSNNQNQQKNDNKPAPKPYADKLGKDGKLTPEERQRRFTNNLCLFCGKAGHSAKDCRQKNSSAAKARAAQTQTATVVEVPNAEPKN